MFDNIGKALTESCNMYYSTGAGGPTVSRSTALMKSLGGMYAVDTPIGGESYETGNTSVRGQVAKQAEMTLLQRNMLLNQIDSVSGHWISYAIKSIIASDGFNDLCSKYDIYIKYTDADNPEK